MQCNGNTTALGAVIGVRIAHLRFLGHHSKSFYKMQDFIKWPSLLKGDFKMEIKTQGCAQWMMYIPQGYHPNKKISKFRKFLKWLIFDFS